MSALDPSAPGLPLAGGGGGGAPSGPAGGDLGGTYPNPTVTDLTIASEARGDILRRGASAWQRVSAKTSGNVVAGDGTDVVSAAIATPLAVDPTANLAALGALIIPDLTTGTYTPGTDVTAVVTATSIVATIASGAAAGDGATVSLAWPASWDFELTFRAVHVKAPGSAGDQLARATVTLGGGLAAQTWVWVNAQEGSTTQIASNWPATPHGKVGSGSATSWLRLRCLGSRLTLYVSDTSTFGGPMYDESSTTFVRYDADASATIATFAIKLEQTTAPANVSGNTITFDNFTIRPL